MEEKPLIDPVWRECDPGVWKLWFVNGVCGYAAHLKRSETYVWHATVNRILEIAADLRPIDVRKAACEQALRDAGYRFADDPPRGSMTRGLPLADELDPATYLPHAIAALHDVLKVGAERYPDEKWKTQNVAEHLRHAREHIRLHTIGDESEPHLRHALTRLAFAVEINEGSVKCRK